MSAQHCKACGGAATGTCSHKHGQFDLPWCDGSCAFCSTTAGAEEARAEAAWATRGWTPTDTANGLRYLTLALEQSGHSEFCPTQMVAPTCACDCWKADAAPLIAKWKKAIGVK